MTFYSATLGELLIIEIFVFFIWAQVLLDAVKSNDHSLRAKKLLLTSLALVLSSIAVAGIMSFRLYELTVYFEPYIWAIVGLYVMLAVSGFLLMVSASIGQSTKTLKLFFVVSGLWTAYCFAATYFGW